MRTSPTACATIPASPASRRSRNDTPENIIEHPASDFVRDFILHQLEVKRNNIYSLFSEDHAADPADPARREPALVRA